MDTIIDGYNLIFQCGLEGRVRTPIAIQNARTRMIDEISAAVPSAELASITIVFDATKLPVSETEAVSTKNGMKVIFAIDHEDADTLIEELIRRHSSPKQLRVVSSDHRLHKAALRRNASPIDSDVWFDRLSNSDARSQSKTSPRATDSKKDAIQGLQDVDWNREFGFDETKPASDDFSTDYLNEIQNEIDEDEFET